jgi:TDG/mug DNA glycosylase family protein
VLLIGINPAPASVAAGHYYQGQHGRRLWGRLERIGLLSDAEPGREDEAFARAGNGLTDLAKRPTRSASELSEADLAEGVEVLRQKVRAWKPRLILFAYRPPAEALLGDTTIQPGGGPEFEGVMTFLLTSPYARREETERTDRELRELFAGEAVLSVSAPPIASAPTRQTRASAAGAEARSQRITRVDLANGRVGLPHAAKALFPSERTKVSIVLRGRAMHVRYDPRTGPDQERSAVVGIGRRVLPKLVDEDEVLELRQLPDGIVEFR